MPKPHREDLLAKVRNELIEFATMRPPGSRFAVLERQVVITGPKELTELSQAGDIRLLDALIALLKEPDRAWAAQILLARMTRREEKVVDTYATSPEEWWQTFGESAYERWRAWLEEARDQLVWDARAGAFVEQG